MLHSHPRHASHSLSLSFSLFIRLESKHQVICFLLLRKHFFSSLFIYKFILNCFLNERKKLIYYGICLYVLHDDWTHLENLIFFIAVFFYIDEICYHKWGGNEGKLIFILLNLFIFLFFTWKKNLIIYENFSHFTQNS